MQKTLFVRARRFSWGACLLILSCLLLSACSSLAIPGIPTATATLPPRTATRAPLFPAASRTPAKTSPTARPKTATHTASPTPPDTETPTPLPPTLVPTQTRRPPATQLPSVPVIYDMDVTINYAAKTLDITETISYQNRTGQTLNSLVLAVEPNLRADIFSLEGLAINDALTDQYELNSHRLTVRLPAPLPNRKTVTLTLAYHLELPFIEPSTVEFIRPRNFGYTDRQINLVNWYPFIVPYRAGVGWILHTPLTYGEYLVYEPAHYTVAVRFADAGTRPVVAASGQPEVGANVTYYRAKNIRAFALSISNQFKIMTQRVGNLTVKSYYLSNLYELSAQGALEAATIAVQTYSDLFGNYPRQTLSIVQNDFNDSLEFDGLFFVGSPYYDQYETNEQLQLVSVVVHETAHQWWFGRVGNDQYEEPWLDEALAMYSEELFYEMNFPENVPWWWENRIDAYQPQGYIDLSVLDYGGATPYTNAVYRMGAHFLDELRQRLGDEIFFTFIKDYAMHLNNKIATTADFFDILQKNTNPDADDDMHADIRDLIAIYFKTPR